MAERKLSNRRKRSDKGEVIRVSRLVYEALNSARRARSWDSYFRRMFGFPDRNGNEQTLIEGMLEVQTGTFVIKCDDATWAEVEELVYKLAWKRAEQLKSKRIEKPLKMRELP